MGVLSDLDTPVFAAEGVPADTDPSGWKIEIGGLAEKPATISLSDVKALGQTRVDARLTSVSGWSVRVEWDGLLWRDFTAAHPPAAGATHVTFHSPGGYTTTSPLEQLDHPRVLLCWGAGGEPLEPDYGGPLRMVIPNLWGYKSCKWVVKINYVDDLVPGYWESRGYTNHGRIEESITLDVNSGKRKVIQGGEVTEF